MQLICNGRIKSTVPVIAHGPIGPPGAYNGSLCRIGENYYFAARHGGWGSKISLTQLDRYLNPMRQTQLELDAEFCKGGAEDPRLINVSNRLYMAFTGLHQVDGGWFGKQCLALLSPLGHVLRAEQLKYEYGQPWEKNWQFWESDGNLLAIYLPYPHKILAVNLATWDVRHVSEIPWRGLPPWLPSGQMRGGCPPVAVGNELWHWFHTYRKFGDQHVYAAGVYTFDPQQPFSPLRIFPGLVLEPVRSDQQKDVCYPCGAVLEGDSWLVTFGVDDTSNWVVRLPHEEIERRMLPIPGTGWAYHLGKWCRPNGTSLESFAVHEFKSPLGVHSSNEPDLDTSIAIEVIADDCYRLKKLAQVAKPKVIWDIGTGAGQVSMLCRHLWPDARIIGFEADMPRLDMCRLNVPGIEAVHARVGFNLSGRQMLNQFGTPDLVCVDIEGGEVPWFWQMEAEGLLPMLKLIVGEWHMWSGRRLLESALGRNHVARFVDPLPGAGPWSYFFAMSRDVPELADARHELTRWLLGVD